MKILLRIMTYFTGIGFFYVSINHLLSFLKINLSFNLVMYVLAFAIIPIVILIAFIYLKELEYSKLEIIKFIFKPWKTWLKRLSLIFKNDNK